MAIPSSGPLKLSTIQTEFGGINPISLSEYYAGGANVPSGTSGTNGAVPPNGAISISKFYGTSKVIDTQTVTVGTFSFKGILNRGFTSILAGSISDGTFNPVSNATIQTLSWSNVGNSIQFELAGVRANSGWTNMQLSGVDYARAAATFNDNGGSGPTNWSWPASDPFGADGTTSVAVFL
jgi:hypothetical protein